MTLKFLRLEIPTRFLWARPNLSLVVLEVDIMELRFHDIPGLGLGCTTSQPMPTPPAILRRAD